jgi:transcriptional regulator with XRE-family HTH domain
MTSKRDPTLPGLSHDMLPGMPSHDDEPEVTLGGAVRYLRRKHGYSQEHLAMRMTAAGYPWKQMTVARTEAADRPIRVNEAVALAHIFDVTISYLLAPRHEAGDELELQIMEARRVFDDAQRAAAMAWNDTVRTRQERDAAQARLKELMDQVAGDDP